ncbi:ileal sodium/bile acid cotransporter isoform X2 [Anabrus simplex]|uniref:ileal sodium/bile acid cotransporter isoform X2 n=1 Tax=Anabrus simplex TaxID=316456 RepID=UPI0035A3195D
MGYIFTSRTSYFLSFIVFCGCIFPSISTEQPSSWEVTYEPENLLQIPVENETIVKFYTSDLTPDEVNHGVVTLISKDIHESVILPVNRIWVLSEEHIKMNWSSNFTVIANFLGYANIHLEMRNKVDESLIKISNPFNVTVVRRERVIDKVFTYSVATLASVIYINFGCAVDWTILKRTLKRPIGPVIGFVSQFLFMPVISFFLAKILFPEQVAMQLGMFFTGVSPAGGASNIWTYALGGNLNLSITMTTISTLAAFVMMPAWIFTVGRLIFASGKMTIPYARIAEIATGLIIPLGIGFIIQWRLPRLSKLMVRILKPFATLLIAFIVIFAIITNLYLFKLFSWQIIVAGLGLPWLGYFCGSVIAKILRQPAGDILAIAIETGTQNTGISIFMLRFSLGQPEADLTTVIPVAVAIMTPIPMITFFILKKILKIKDCDKAANTEDNSNGLESKRLL